MGFSCLFFDCCIPLYSISFQQNVGCQFMGGKGVGVGGGGSIFCVVSNRAARIVLLYQCFLGSVRSDFWGKCGT